MKRNKPKALRVERGLRQEDVHDVLGLSINAYRNKEAGRTRWYFDEIERLAEFYNVPIATFVTNTESEGN